MSRQALTGASKVALQDPGKLPTPSPHQEGQKVAHDLTGQERSGTLFLLLLAGYFLLQVAIRLSLSDSLDLDEAEQVLAFRHIQLGYGRQPPVYSWLQGVFFTVFGVNLFSLAALKNGLLFCTYACLFYAARPLIGTRGAIASSASLLLLPQIAWESQRDLTHSVLLTCLASATLWCYFAIVRKPSVIRYVLLGVLIGLGLQSKYNFALFVAALVSASLLIEQHRRIVWNRKIGIAVLMAILCFLPHALWLIGHFQAAAGGTLQKMNEGSRNAGYVQNVLGGVGSMLLASLAFITPMWIIYGVVCRRQFKDAAIDWLSASARFFVALYASSFAWLMLLILTGGVSKLKDRWLQPLLFSVPLAVFVLYPALANKSVTRRIIRACAVSALLILLAVPLRVYMGPMFGKQVRAHYPYPQLSSELAKRFPEARTLVVGDKLAAGNLYFQRPETDVIFLYDILQAPEPLHGDVLVVINKGAGTGWLERFHAVYPDSTVQQQGRLDLPYLYGSAGTMSFDYALIRVRSQ